MSKVEERSIIKQGCFKQNKKRRKRSLKNVRQKIEKDIWEIMKYRKCGFFVWSGEEERWKGASCKARKGSGNTASAAEAKQSSIFLHFIFFSKKKHKTEVEAAVMKK